ncbi:MAG: efflux RND transporter periplasmic adaptor subunit [Rhodospirillaceae bacterium]|nr:efflux RND transporter periplasmic adaptor subunit [Rhodospirillaceae bacterium]MBT6139514.1 efflux RND transporter periplasmic adaptor subunit [Rhodospirillaceae bacterium]
MRINLSLITAGIIAVVAVGWIVSGQFGDQPATAANQGTDDMAATGEAGHAVTRVRVRASTAEPYVATIRVTGQTAASRIISLRSRTEGTIVSLGAQKGAAVKTGQVLVRLGQEDLPARMENAEARIRQRQVEYDAAQKLAKRGFQAETKRAAAEAELTAAQTELARIQILLNHTVIQAPFAAVLDQRPVELGDALRKGDPVAVLLDLDPLLVTAHVSEDDFLKLSVGQAAIGRLLNGQELKGSIRYIAVAGDPATRTFKVEMAFPNPGYAIVQGISAVLELPMPTVNSHSFSAALLTIDDDGRLGIKSVGIDNKVAFHPVNIVGGTAEKVQVSGLPEQVDIITVGQDFVSAGDIVDPVREDQAQTSGTKTGETKTGETKTSGAKP